MKKYDKLVDGEWRQAERVNGVSVLTRGGRLWGNMQSRCKQGSVEGAGGKYEGSTCGFVNFQHFMSWATAQPGYEIDWELDKDLLYKGNKLYSEATCVFVPRAVNMLLTSSRRSRGALPVGVSWSKKAGKYLATYSRANKKIFIGLYGSVDLAFSAYKSAKESYAKSLAEEFKGQLDPRAYEALHNYAVQVTD